jgi:hypothetical protein
LLAMTNVPVPRAHIGPFGLFRAFRAVGIRNTS